MGKQGLYISCIIIVCIGIRIFSLYIIDYKCSCFDNMKEMCVCVIGMMVCYSNWSSKYIEISKSEINIKTHLEGLKPNTQYALYVQSDTVVDADSGVRSEISYITTLPHSKCVIPAGVLQYFHYEVRNQGYFIKLSVEDYLNLV